MRGRGWFLVGFLVLAVFAGLLAYGDVGQIGALLAGFPPGWFAAAAGLALLNYALRYARWWLYLRALDAHVPHAVSLPVFMAGLALSITPGQGGGDAQKRLAESAGGGCRWRSRRRRW